MTEARDPNWVWVSTGEGGPDDWRRQFQAWKDADVTHVSVNSSYDRGPHIRIAGKTLVHQLAAMTSDRETIADLPCARPGWRCNRRPIWPPQRL